jgi:protease secretion system membrane fusion protein
MEIKSPSTGQVVGLTVQTVGAVLQPGQKILDVVPDNQTLLLEAHIPPHLIDKVQAGLSTDVRFNAFAHSPQLVVEGKASHGDGADKYYRGHSASAPRLWGATITPSSP